MENIGQTNVGCDDECPGKKKRDEVKGYCVNCLKFYGGLKHSVIAHKKMDWRESRRELFKDEELTITNDLQFG